MGRGASYGSETTEFVTKRICLLSVLAISFLCLLAGFIIGRFVSDQMTVMRDAQMLQTLDANGLTKTSKMRDDLMNLLNHSSFHDHPDMIPEVKHLKKMNASRTMPYLFMDFSIFTLNIRDNPNCIVATICGSEEQDRYIVLSVGEQSFDVAYKVARAFDHMYRDKNTLWQPKRSMIFCVFFGKTDFCRDAILERIKPKIVAYIAIHGKAAIGYDKIAVSGTGMVQATMLEAVNEVKLYNGMVNLTVADSPLALQKLDIDLPHVVLSFIDENGSMQYSSENQKTLAQIVGITMFRLSEGIFFKWKPNYFADVMNKTLNKLASKPALVQTYKDNLNETVQNLTRGIKEFNLLLDKTNMLKLLDVRMMNDKLIDLDRALVCRKPPPSSSIVDFAIFNQLSSNNDQMFINVMKDIQDCYEEANRIIVDHAQCGQIVHSNLQPCN